MSDCRYGPPAVEQRQSIRRAKTPARRFNSAEPLFLQSEMKSKAFGVLADTPAGSAERAARNRQMLPF